MAKPQADKERVAEIVESFALYRLACIGLEGYRTRTGRTAVDVVVLDPRVDLQTKGAVVGRTRRGTETAPHWSVGVRGRDHPRPNLFYLFAAVDATNEMWEVVRSYVIPSSVVSECTTAVFKAFCAGGGSPSSSWIDVRDDFGKYACDPWKTGWLERYEDRWDLLEDFPG